jgi:hypothetical protein
MQTTLRDKTLELVRDRPRRLTYKELEKQTGLPYLWIQHFAQERYHDPSVNRVETLYTFLSGRAVISE